MNKRIHYPYTEVEVCYILKNFHSVKYKDIAKKLNRTLKGIKHKVHLLGFSKKDKTPSKKKIDKIIKEQFPTKTYTPLEKYLLKHYKNEQVKDIAQKFNVSQSHVRNLVEHKLKIATKQSRITKKELEFIEENYGKLSIETICKTLGKTKISIQLIASRNDWHVRPSWTEEDINFLKSNYGKIPNFAIGKILNRTTRAVGHLVTELKLYTYTKSSLETNFEFLLKSLKIKFQTQQKIWKYRIDFLCDKVVFETNGSYWHCDPRVFIKGPINKMQKKSILRDERKLKYLTSKGYQVHIIWEKDLNENYEQVKQYVIAALASNG